MVGEQQTVEFSPLGLPALWYRQMSTHKNIACFIDDFERMTLGPIDS
jgi:hypothetical protein